ncbi:monoamine oxidase [Blastococcus aggregatus]|uniref:Monoamine oxidase n=1 Tax=Blastococcus aggregatus TaxID=38502 RepID=A0A285VHR0_9ACTN|nr:flavin monoamine oxidase family protein [Blastococcus aggregatus]SOC52716.1 monoamine oxidase [Blastococcus aggregatus]
MDEVDVVVVGAGFAGLVAATDVLSAGRSVVVLEARDRVGGRTETVRLAGAELEAGGQWTGPGQDELARLASRLGVPTFPQPAAGDEVVIRPDGTAVRTPAGLVDALDTAAFEELTEAMAALDALAGTVDVAAPWQTPDAEALDGSTLESWMQAHIASSDARTALRITVRGIFATDPANLSLLHALFYVAAGGGWMSLVGTEGGAQQDRFEGGLQEIALRLAADLGDAVRLRTPVRRLAHDAHGVRAEFDGGSVRARWAVVAVPPTLAARLDYVPALPPARDQLTQRLPGGSVIKFHVVYDRPWWRDQGLNGSAFCLDGPVSVTYDATTPGRGPGVLTGFVEGADGVAFGRLGQQERGIRVIEVLVRAFGDDARHPTSYVDRDWSAEPWTRGCYGAHFPPGAWTQLGPALREPVGRLHWAGTETATRWMGYVDGAIESGHRAAREVLA